jgi:hypothetical protein
MRNLLIIAVFILSQLGLSQDQKNQRIFTNFNGNGSIGFPSPTKGDVQGTMYVFPEFTPVKVGGEQQIFLVRYNAFNDRMEFKDNDNIFEYYPNVNDKDFYLLGINKRYHYVNYKSKDGRFTNGYLLELYAGKGNKFFKKERIKFVPGQVSKTGYDRTYPDKYVKDSDVYYIQLGEGEIIEVPTNKKEFLKMFGDKESKVSDLLKKEGYNFKDEKDIIKIMNAI